MEKREKVIEKLVKIKALAERGVGGEKETAVQMYEALKAKYNISDEEIKLAAVELPDISEIDLKQFWGLAMTLGIIANNLREELEFCDACPHTHTEDGCSECGTHWNIRDLQIEYETAQVRLQKAAMEV